VVCKPLIEFEPHFLFFVLVAMNLNQYAQGVAQPGLAVQNITPLPIILPPIKLQQEFADKIQSIEKQKAAVNQSIAETQKLLDYTMDKYFG
jgi:type I restriction enzyme S subunit